MASGRCNFQGFRRILGFTRWTVKTQWFDATHRAFRCPRCSLVVINLHHRDTETQRLREGKFIEPFSLCRPLGPDYLARWTSIAAPMIRSVSRFLCVSVSRWFIVHNHLPRPTHRLRLDNHIIRSSVVVQVPLVNPKKEHAVALRNKLSPAPYENKVIIVVADHRNERSGWI